MNTRGASTERFALIGYPVAHSYSPFIHARFASQLEKSLSYELLEAPATEFAAAVRRFFTAGGRGLNVTLPHKEAAAELADTLREPARIAGAVNTLARDPEAGLIGTNTDGAGLVRDLVVNNGLGLRDRRLLMLGAGGAARGAAGPVLAEQPARLVIANRTVDRATELAKRFRDQGEILACGYDQLGNASFDLIINATSAGLQGLVPAVPGSLIHSDTVCYDMAYGEAARAFTRWARERGAETVLQGWGMLVEQAAESFQFWHGVRPDTGAVLAALASG